MYIANCGFLDVLRRNRHGDFSEETRWQNTFTICPSFSKGAGGKFPGYLAYKNKTKRVVLEEANSRFQRMEKELAAGIGLMIKPGY